MYNFRSFSNKFPTIFWSLIFHISLPRSGCFPYKDKRKSKIFGFKNVMERGIIKNLNFVIHILHLKFSGSPCNFEKTRRFSRLEWPNRCKFYCAAYGMHFWESGEPKECFQCFQKETPSLGAPKIQFPCSWRCVFDLQMCCMLKASYLLWTSIAWWQLDLRSVSGSETQAYLDERNM